MTVSENMGFHESTVVGFRSVDADVEIELEDVRVGDGKVARVGVTVLSVTAIYVDSQPVNVIAMEAEDGEILTLEIAEKNLLCIIEWNDFSNKKSFTKAYRISGNKVSTRLIA